MKVNKNKTRNAYWLIWRDLILLPNNSTIADSVLKKTNNKNKITLKLIFDNKPLDFLKCLAYILPT